MTTVGPIVEELAKEYDGKAVIGKVNVDNNPNISMNYGIRNIPTLLIFKNGEIVDKQVGAVPKSIDKAVDKIEAQLLKYKSKHKKEKNNIDKEIIKTI